MYSIPYLSTNKIFSYIKNATASVCRIITVLHSRRYELHFHFRYLYAGISSHFICCPAIRCCSGTAPMHKILTGASAAIRRKISTAGNVLGIIKARPLNYFDAAVNLM
jgi:hypothetical protein